MLEIYKTKLRGLSDKSCQNSLFEYITEQYWVMSFKALKYY